METVSRGRDIQYKAARAGGGGGPVPWSTMAQNGH